VVNRFIDYYWAVVGSVVRKENNIKEDVGSVSVSGAVPVYARNI